jgi:hypothetical protein
MPSESGETENVPNIDISEYSAVIEPHTKLSRIVFLPGNFNTAGSWVPKAKDTLEKMMSFPNHEIRDIDVLAPITKDLIIGRKNQWENQTGDLLDEHTLLFCHSTGTTHAFDEAQNHKLWGIIAESPYDTPELGLVSFIEKMGGRFNQPWDWEKICQNVNFFAVIAPLKDKNIPKSSTDRIIGNLKHNMPDWEKRLTIIRPGFRGHLPVHGFFYDSLRVAEDWIKKGAMFNASLGANILPAGMS